MSLQKTDVLLVAAHAPDLVGFRQYLGDSLEGTLEGVRVRSKVVGFGSAAAASAASRAALALTPRCILHIGTCGVFPGLSDVRPADPVLIRQVGFVDVLTLEQRAEAPSAMPLELETDAVLRTALAGAASRIHVLNAASFPSQLVDDDLASALGRHVGLECENGEVFALATASKGAEVPFASILGITHVVGSMARTDVNRFRREAATAAAAVVVNWIYNGVAGLPSIDRRQVG